MGKRFLSLLVALVLVLGCTGFAAAENTEIALTDMADREIVLDAPATRVVALAAADCEIICALGAQDRLVGRGEYCDYPQTIAEIPVVQSGAETNIEQIVALNPDVVIMSKMAQTTEQNDALESAGITVVISDAQDLAGVYQAIEMIGRVTGKDDAAAEMVLSMQAGFAALADRVSGDGSRTVYFEVSPLEYGLWAAGENTFMDELATMLGLTNVFSDLDGWAEVSEEQVIERNPDYIVTTAMNYGDGLSPAEEISARAGWQALKAVKDGHVFNADANAITRPGPRLLDAAEALYAFVYGTEE